MWITLWLIASLTAGGFTADGAASVARDCVEVGWHDGFAADAGWRREPSRVNEPDEAAVERFGPDGGVFEVRTPGRAMGWTRTTTPVWIAAFPWLEADYEVAGESCRGGDGIIRLSDGSTGPVTPGALNPENPLASGAVASVGPATPGHHRLVVDLRPLFRSDRVAEITIFVRSDREPTRLTVRRLAFRASDPARAPAPSPQAASRPLLPDGGDATTMTATPAGEWQAIALPTERAIPAEWLGRAFESPIAWPDDRRCRAEGIPFQLADAEHAAAATGVMEREAIELAGDWQGCELGLLLASRTFGNDRPIASPHELLVRLEYGDGTRRSHFPWSVARGRFEVERRPAAYVVPLDRAKRLVRVTITDAMDAGQVFLLAAGVNRSSQPLCPSLANETPVATRPTRAAPAAAPVQVTRREDELVARSAWLEFTAALRSGLDIRSLRLVPFGRTVIAENGGPLLSLADEHGRGVPLALRDVRISEEADATTCAILWAAGDEPSRRHVSLDVRIDAGGEIRLTPGLVNDGESPWKATVTCPQLDGCRIAASMEDAWYLLGTRSTVIDRCPAAIDTLYSDTFPLQLIDLFDARSGGGLGMIVADAGLRRKSFRFRQTADGAGLGVRFLHVEVPAGGRLALPTSILFAHAGDWHDACARYRQWARGATAGHRRTGLADLFFCRRDYPLGGTGYLFDVRGKQYTPGELIAESVRSFGGIDMIDISGWAYNETAGRVGQYRTNDLGGLPELRRAIGEAHRRGVKVGLYFEGYLLDRRSILAKDAMPAWQLVGRDGRPQWWPASDKEFFVCPGVRPWREAFARVVADVAHETGADAVYVDEFGLADAGKECWSPDHGHAVPSNPAVEEGRGLEAIRRALDERTPNVGIYVEFVPVDAQMGLVEAAFDYGMTMPVGPAHVTKLPLHRFVFPEVAPVQMVGHGIRPPPTGADDLHRCVFHGVAMWLKGRGDSWWTPAFREAARRAYPIFREHAGAFRSPDCEPLVPTLRADVYANRFATPDRSVITVYNARFSDVSGDLLRIRLPEGWRVHDLWNGRPAEVHRDGSETIIRGAIEPRSVGVFLATGER